MKDLRYILIDYGRYKDLENIKKLKENIGKYFLTIAIAILIIVGFFIFVQKIKLDICLTILIIVILWVFIIVLFYKKDEEFSMFGPYSQLKMLFMKKTIGGIVQEAEETRKRKKISIKKSMDRVPEWFGGFLREKGINENNIDLLISELKEKYDYHIIKVIFGMSGWIVSFYGWDNFIQFGKNLWKEGILPSSIIVAVMLGYGVYVLNDSIMRKKGKLHPLIYIKGRKNELLHDLELMKVEWSMLRKQREKVSRLIYKK